MIPFNKPPYTGNEDKYVLSAMRNDKISGDGVFSRRCQEWFEQTLVCSKALLTPSCTHALEMAAILLDIKPGDEVIMPSYTFVSTANAFVLRGAQIVFVDIRPDTMNIDETLIEAAITPQTKVIVAVHYAGVSCEMDAIMDLAKRYKLWVVEDAAQGMMSSYKGHKLGTIGHLAAFSFHETKNYTSGGEGGLLIINDSRFCDRAEIIREKGTNRSQFFRGMVNKYTWVDIGSSFLPSELQAAYLWAGIEMADIINENRIATWLCYDNALKKLEETGLVSLPKIPSYCKHNGHMYYLKTNNLSERARLLEHLSKDNILAVFHYVPLHTSPAGKHFSKFHGQDRYTTLESERLVRLPLWYKMDSKTVNLVINSVLTFYNI